jgi:hypothetical protein
VKVIKTELKQRAFDSKWQLLGLIMDHDNAYTYTTESGAKVSLVPEKWITLGVYDYLMEIEDD